MFTCCVRGGTLSLFTARTGETLFEPFLYEKISFLFQLPNQNPGSFLYASAHLIRPVMEEVSFDSLSVFICSYAWLSRKRAFFVISKSQTPLIVIGTSMGFLILALFASSDFFYILLLIHYCYFFFKNYSFDEDFVPVRFIRNWA